MTRLVIDTNEATVRAAERDYMRFYAGFAALSRAYSRLKALAPPEIADRIEADLRAEFNRLDGGSVDRQGSDQFGDLLDDVLRETSERLEKTGAPA